MILGSLELNGLTGHEAGRALLYRLWTEHMGTPLPEIAVEDRGKPYFVGNSWHFSISHTRKRAFCALSPVPVGIDAEEMDRDVNLRLAEKILSPAEKEQFDRAEDKRLALLKFWVLKEAAAKSTGEGIRGYPNRTDFSLDDPRVRQMEGCLVAVVTE